MLTETKSLFSNLITRKAVIAVGNGVLSAHCPGKMAGSDGSMTY